MTHDFASDAGTNTSAQISSIGRACARYSRNASTRRSARPFSPAPLSEFSGTEGWGSSATAVLVVCAQHISIGDHVLKTSPMDRWAARALLLAVAAVAFPS